MNIAIQAFDQFVPRPFPQFSFYELRVCNGTTRYICALKSILYDQLFELVSDESMPKHVRMSTLGQASRNFQLTNLISYCIYRKWLPTS